MLDHISPAVGSVAIRTTPASSRHRAPADRKFTQCKYTPATVINAPITHSIFRRSQTQHIEWAFAICMCDSQNKSSATQTVSFLRKLIKPMLRRAFRRQTDGDNKYGRRTTKRWPLRPRPFPSR
jgi:hypothetical protein